MVLSLSGSHDYIFSLALADDKLSTGVEREFNDRIPHLSHNEFQVDIETAKRPNVR